MRAGGNQLRFSQHKDAIAAVFKLQPGKWNVRILFHQMYHAVADFTNQDTVIAEIIRRAGQDPPS